MKLTRAVARLAELHGDVAPPPGRDPFEAIVWEIAAYLVDDERRNAVHAALRARIGVTPEAIAKAKKPAIAAAIAAGGMRPEDRVEKLKKAAALALELGPLGDVSRRPLKEAVKLLRRFPSIGEPGAEKLALFFGDHPLLALDSNGLRVLLRLGYGEEATSYATSYKSAQKAAMNELPADPGALKQAHLLLREHGKTICRRSTPRCEACPVKKTCAYFASLA